MSSSSSSSFVCCNVPLSWASLRWAGDWVAQTNLPVWAWFHSSMLWIWLCKPSNLFLLALCRLQSVSVSRLRAWMGSGGQKKRWCMGESLSRLFVHCYDFLPRWPVLLLWLVFTPWFWLWGVLWSWTSWWQTLIASVEGLVLPHALSPHFKLWPSYKFILFILHNWTMIVDSLKIEHFNLILLTNAASTSDRRSAVKGVNIDSGCDVQFLIDRMKQWWNICPYCWADVVILLSSSSWCQHKRSSEMCWVGFSYRRRVFTLTPVTWATT